MMKKKKKTKYRNGTSQDAHHIDNRRLNRCFVDYYQKLIYVYTHKNASESIRRIIPVFLQNHHDYESIHERDRFNKFWVVRNPFDRVISSFQEMRKLRTDGPYYITETMEWFKCPIVVESFDLFLDQIKKNYYDPHCFPQVISLFDKGLTEKEVDIILFDNLNHELRLFFQKYNIKHNELLNIHKSRKKIKSDLKKFIEGNKSIQNKIIDLYPEDYEIYQYHKKSRNRQSVKRAAKHPPRKHAQHFSIDDPRFTKLIRLNIRKLVSGSGYTIHEIDPIHLLTPERFDVTAKVIYARHRELKVKSDWAKRLYAEHLRVFNGFHEPDGTDKGSFEAFQDSFHETLDAVKSKGFEKDLSLVPVGLENILLDGSHRAAACILYNQKLTGLFCDFAAYIYDYTFFRNHKHNVKSGLTEKWTDPMALEYCRLKNNTYIVTVFPSAEGEEETVRSILDAHGKIVYEKYVGLKNYGPVLLMRQMYSGEEWVGDSHNRFAGAHQKADLCFSKKGSVRVFVLEADNPKSVKKAKEKIRSIFNIGNHSIHINDDHADTIKLAGIFFNENSIHFLNNAQPDYFKKFHDLFGLYKDWAERQSMDPSCFCIDGSAVLAAYGLRQARDLDFLHFGGEEVTTGIPMIENHNSEAHHHVIERDDIIFNPENHFYYEGLKFVTLDILRAMKKKRNEEKDKRDVALIDGLEKQISGKIQRKVAPARSSKLINIVYGHTRANGFSVHKDNTTIVWSGSPLENCDLYAFQDAFSFTGRRSGINVLLMHEPIVVLPGQYDENVWNCFDRVFTSLESLADGDKKFIKFNHPVFDGPYDSQSVKSIDLGYKLPIEEKENAVCMISGNKYSQVKGELYSKRVEIARWFHDHSDIRFDVYGRPPFDQLPNYLGELNPHTEKFVTLARYRYSLCFENVYDPFWSKGYLTEKLLHCLMCGTVPIYLGCSNIEDYVPEECFIDYRRFNDPARLADYLKGLSDSDYKSYLDDIRDWVESGNLAKFSIHHTYDMLAALADPTASRAEISSRTWEKGPAPEHEGLQLVVTATPRLWSWTDLASKIPSTEMFSGDFTLTDNHPAGLTGQDVDWSNGNWCMRPVPNPYGLIEINGVQGFLGQGDVIHLYKKARNLPQNGVIVEIGSFMGLSSIVMGCGLRDSGNYNARIYCVDSWDNRYLEKVKVSDTRELYDIFRENIVRAGLQSFIYPIRKRSMEAVSDFDIHSVDLLFIDGDHSFESCYADLASWYQKVRPGGIIVGHDCRPGQGVHKAVEKFSSECKQDYSLLSPPQTNYMFEVEIADVPMDPIEKMISYKKPYNNAVKADKEQLVSIIILNFNGAAHIQKCIESIKAHTDEPYELIIIDNASTDGSLEYLRSLDDITLVENPENLGCPPARTQAMALARGEYVVLLDNDTLVTPGWLDAFVRHAKRNPSIGLFGPCSNHVSGPQKVPDAPYSDTKGLNEFALIFSAQHKGNLIIVPRLVGFCMFIKRAVIEKIGAPDPQFGKFGFEDDDYTWRAIIAGFQAAIAQDIFIHHVGGPQMSGDDRLNRYLHEAWDVFKKKWALPPELEYGVPFNTKEILSQPFNPNLHFIPVPDQASVSDLITSRGRHSTTGLPSQPAMAREERLAGGERQFEKGEFSEAEKTFLSLLDDDVYQARAHNNLGVLYYTTGDKEKSLHHYQQAVRLNPENIIFQKNLADFYSLALGRVEEALKIYVKVLEDQPRDTETLLVTGHICIALQRFDDAKVFYDRVLEIDPGNMDARQNLNKIVGCQPDQKDTETDEKNYNNSRQDDEQGMASHKRYTHASIIIPTSGNQKYLKTCVESIEINTPRPYELVFINNGAAKGTLKWLKRRVNENSNYRMVKCPKNEHFARSYNEGVKAAKGDPIVIMHDDVIVSRGWFEDMNRSLNSGGSVGVVGPMTNAAQGRQKDRRADDAEAEQFDDYAVRFRKTNRYRRTPVRTLSDFCIMFSRELIRKTGLFDETFETPSLMVEDFCVRASVEGHENIVASDVFMHHYDLDPPDQGALIKDRKEFDAKWRGIDAGSLMGRNLYVMNLLETADALDQKGDTDAAVKTLIDGIGHYPDCRRIYYSLTQILINAGRHKDALEALENIPDAEGKKTGKRKAADKSGDRDIHRLVLAGYSLEGLQQNNRAERCADRALALDGNFAPALNLKGILAYGKGNLDKAESFFHRALESDAGYGEPYTNLGVLRLAGERTDEAVDFLEKGFILSPGAKDIAETFHSAATVTGALENAERLFADAVSLMPDNRHLKYLLIDLLIRHEKYDRALKQIEDVMIAFGTDDELISAALEIRDKIGPMKIPSGRERGRTISLCMIVKNEAHDLARCLGSVKPVVHEMVIMDTGSTDRTKDIAKVFGARVYDLKWTDDFSAARNASLSKAKGDWILALDADEVIAPVDHEIIRDAVKCSPKGPVAYAVTTRNYVHSINTPGWVANDGTYRGEEAGTGWYPSTKIRLFSNNPSLRFEGRVHELVEPSLKGTGIRPTPCAVPVHHYGKLVGTEITSKGEEYYLLGKKKIDEKDGDLDSLVELATQAAELKRHREAVDLWRQVIGLKADMPLAYLNMSNSYMELGDYPAGLEASKKALNLEPGLKEAVLNYSTCALCAGESRNAIMTLEGLLKHVPDHPVGIALLSGGYCIEKNRKKAFQLMERIKKMGFECSNYLIELAGRLVSSHRVESAVLLLEAAVESGNADGAVLSLLNECRSMKK